MLGGVTFEGGTGLVGHSDADAVAHAVIDALLGAAGLGDIGQHFPDTDPGLAGADSLELLRQAAAVVRAAGWVPGNVDCTVVLEAPKLAPRRVEMEERLTDAVGAPVTVKATRAEGLGAIGRREGIACFAVALVTVRAEADTDGEAAAEGHEEALRAAQGADAPFADARAAFPRVGAGDRPPACRAASKGVERLGSRPRPSAKGSVAIRWRVARPCASSCSHGGVACARCGCSPNRTRRTCSPTSWSWPSRSA